MTGFAVGAFQDLFLNFLLDTLFFPCKELVVVLTAGTLGVKAPAVVIRPSWSCLGAKKQKHLSIGCIRFFSSWLLD